MVLNLNPDVVKNERLDGVECDHRDTRQVREPVGLLTVFKMRMNNQRSFLSHLKLGEIAVCPHWINSDPTVEL